MGGKSGDRGGELEEVELVLTGRLIRPPNEPSNVLWVGVAFNVNRF